jgi:TRAP-type C4-dicarboxylate transport system substrate-binding protein
MMKIVAGIVCIISFLVFLPPSTEAQDFQWKFTHWTKPKDLRTDTFKFFENRVEELTGNGIKITRYDSNQLVAAKDLYTALTKNVVQMGAYIPLYFVGHHPLAGDAASFPAPPGVTFKEFPNALRQPGGTFDLLTSEYSRHNMVPVFFFPPYQEFFSKTPIKSMEDLEGHLCRFPGGADPILEKLGLKGVQIPLSEVPQAVMTGMVDYIYQAWPTYYLNKLYNSLPYVTITDNIIWICVSVNVNKDAYEALPKGYQDAILQAGKESEQYYAKNQEAVYGAEIKAAESKNLITVYHLSEEQRNRWLKAIQPWWKDMIARHGKPFERLYELYGTK